MNMLEAVQALKEGKKIRMSTWMDPEQHLSLGEKGELLVFNKGKISHTYTLLWGNSYEIYEPKKRKLKDCIGETVTVNASGNQVLIKPFSITESGTILVNVNMGDPVRSSIRAVYSLSGDTEVVE